ncbi:MAG: metallopeptidase family protein [Planctomycetota bacterium]
MNLRQFEKLVRRALEDIPESFRGYLEEVAFMVEDRVTPALARRLDLDPAEPDPLGFYDGVPLGERGSFDTSPVMDTIYVFREPHVEQFGDDRRELIEQVRITVIHEIAHHFGLEEDEVDDLGYG